MDCKSCGKPISVTREGGRCTNEKCEKSGGYKERLPVGKYKADPYPEEKYYELYKPGKKSNPFSLTKKEADPYPEEKTYELYKPGKKSNPLSLTKKEYFAKAKVKAASRGGIAEDVWED